MIILLGCGSSENDNNNFLRVELSGDDVPEQIDIFFFNKSMADQVEYLDLDKDRPTTNIMYSISETSHVNLTIFDIEYAVIDTLVNEEIVQGNHSISWDGKDYLGNDVPSEMYIYRLTTSEDGVIINSIERMFYLLTTHVPNEVMLNGSLRSANKKPFINLYPEVEYFVYDEFGNATEITDLDTTMVYMKDYQTGETQIEYFVAQKDHNGLDFHWNPNSK